MLNAVLTKVFGTRHDREIKSLKPTIDRINGLEEEFEMLTDPELRAKTEHFRARLADGEDLDDL